MSDDIAIGYLAKRLQSTLRQLMDTTLGDEGLTMAQYAAMAALGDADALTNAELARRCFVTPQTMIRIVQTLDDGGWAERRTDPHHQRRVLYSITDLGRDMLARADLRATSVEQRMLAGLDDRQVATLRSLITHCIDNLD